MHHNLHAQDHQGWCEEPCHAWWRAYAGMAMPFDVPPRTCLGDLRPGEWPAWDDRPFETLCEHSMTEWRDHEAAALGRPPRRLGAPASTEDYTAFKDMF